MKASTVMAAAWSAGWIISREDEYGDPVDFKSLDEALDYYDEHNGCEHGFMRTDREDDTDCHTCTFVISDGVVVTPPIDVIDLMNGLLPPK